MSKYMVLLSLGISIALASAAGRAPQSQSIKIEKIVMATSVSNLEPDGVNTEFPASAGPLYCWTKVSSASVPASIFHKWYRDNQQVFEYKLDLKWASTRTWSRKSVTPGKWRVDVTDESGSVLSSVSFTVK